MCYNFWYQSGVPSRLRPGMAIFGDLVLFGFIQFYSVLFGFDGFRRFQNIFGDLGILKMKINSTFPFDITSP